MLHWKVRAARTGEGSHTEARTMGLTDKLMQVVNGARKLRAFRDPKSYSRYERGRDLERKRADHERQAQADSAERTREKKEREHDFEERYAVEHEQHVERERPKRADSS
jgi:hypothetical protein